MSDGSEITKEQADKVAAELAQLLRSNLANMLRNWAALAEDYPGWDKVMNMHGVKICVADLGAGVRLQLISNPSEIRLNAFIQRVNPSGGENTEEGLPAGSVGTPHEETTKADS